MRTLNLPLDDADFAKLEKAKGEKTWYDFIMSLVSR